MPQRLAFSLLLALGCANQPSTPAEPVDLPTNNAGDQAGTMAATAMTERPSAGPAAPPEPGAIPAPSDVAAPPADAQRTATNLASKVLQAGTGTTHPDENDRVTVHYTGWTTDGNMFDSSVQRGRPATFPLNGVIAGWTEGVQLMVTGEKRRFWIPEALAYQGRPGRPQGMLVFDVELLEIQEMPDPPAAPEDVAAERSGVARAHARHRLAPPGGHQPRRGPLQRLDHGRPHVRQQRRAR